MNKWIKRSLYVAPFLLIAGLARSDYTATQGAGTTVFAFVCSVSKVCPASVLINSSNVEIATSGNPVRVDPTGTTTQPVSAASLPLPAGAATSANQTTEIGSLATIATNTGAATPAGSAIIGKVGIDQTTPGTTNAVVATPAAAGGLTTFFLQPAATTNATNIKASPGQVYHIAISSNAVLTTVNYIRFYDVTTAPTCSSATSLKYQLAIPFATGAAGYVEDIAMGLTFPTGIGICVSGGYATTDTTNATASAISINIGYK
jgi:hypothetical protein